MDNPIEFRCPEGKLFGMLVDGLLEVKCQSKFCGHTAGVVVIHRFNLVTGETLETRHFRDPQTKTTKGRVNGYT